MRGAPTPAVERPPPPRGFAAGAADAQDDALTAAARHDFQFLWRVLRRMGVQPDDAVDDAMTAEIAALVGAGTCGRGSRRGRTRRRRTS